MQRYTSIIALLLTCFLIACEKPIDDIEQPTQPTPKDQPDPNSQSQQKTKKTSDAASDQQPIEDDSSLYTEGNPLVEIIVKDRGLILLELFEDTTPNTVKNFVYLADQGLYDGTLFHRVDNELNVVQGGSMTAEDPWPYTIHNEAVDETYDIRGKNRNKLGTISMGRDPDEEHSGGAQFFFNLKDNPGWDSEGSLYCVFGTVISGMPVIESIQPGDVIESVKCIQRKRDTEYVPTVLYPDERVARPADPVTQAKAQPNESEPNE